MLSGVTDVLQGAAESFRKRRKGFGSEGKERRASKKRGELQGDRKRRGGLQGDRKSVWGQTYVRMSWRSDRSLDLMFS